MADSPRLTVGRGMGIRVTKAGKAAEARFDALVTEHLRSIGAVPPRRDAPHLGWTVRTIHGDLQVTAHGNWIAQKFLDWPKDYAACIAHAKARGFDHWKWNFHYELSTKPNIEDWKTALGKILPVNAPQDARETEWRLKYAAAVAHHEELLRQIESAFDYGIMVAGRNEPIRAAIVSIRDRFRRKVG